jgi:branched-chain amino acid transport system substrate-binding protein
VFGSQYISQLKDGKLNVVHKTSIEDGMYEREADYTTQPL